MSGKDHVDRPERAQNPSSFQGDVLQLYKEHPRAYGTTAPTPDHIDFSQANDPYQSSKQLSFDAHHQKEIYKDIRDNHLNIHNFLKSEHKALAGDVHDQGTGNGPPHDRASNGRIGTHRNSDGKITDEAHHPKTISQRTITQQSSIFKGAKSGQISESEFVQLETNQHDIEGLKATLLKDGMMSAEDRKQLTSAIDTQWGTIKEFKYNSDQSTPPSGTNHPGDGEQMPPPGFGTGNSDVPPPRTVSGGSDKPPADPNPGDSGSPPAVTQLIDLNQKFTVSATAKGALNDTPNPISVVQVEGKLPTEAVAIDSRKSLEDMPRMEALGEAYQATKDEKYADKAKQYLLAWAKVNHSTGDPINDAQITNTINTYALIKDSDAMKNDPASGKKIETYLKTVANTEINSTWFAMKENWNAHRIEVIANVGFATNDKSLISKSMNLYKDYLDVNITADGSTLDFHTRDAFYYHNYDIGPLLRIADVANRNGYPGMLDYKGADGGSLRKAIDFEVPYITGEKTHLEFKNSKIKFDQQRASAGEGAFAIKNFDPKRAKYVIELASKLDPSYKKYDKYVD